MKINVKKITKSGFFTKMGGFKKICFKAVPYAAVAFTACFCVVISLLLVSAKSTSPVGQGGFETSTPQVVSESIVAVENEIENIIPEELEIEDLYYYSYRIKKGDMIGVIAQNEGITQDTLISVNHIKNTRLLQIGDYIKIPSMPGILYTTRKSDETIESIAKKYKINEDKCAAVNHVALADTIKEGTTLFLPDAELDWATRQEINGDLFKKPIHSRWYLSSSFGWRSSPFTGKRSYHSGTDMACAHGTPVYAALDGVVVETGFNNTYGNYIIIKHHSGYKTLYGHLSAINCKKGNFVYTNTKIGAVGNTGMSTGPHLHFTVFKNGVAINGAALWG